ncbi:MAG: four helix bundle protein [Chthoniobacterales bacterium]
MSKSFKSFRFEKLDVWHDARRLNRLVYECTKAFPEKERFGLVNQIRRASVSVSSNIAEGSGRNSDPDFARFLEIAYGSLMETASQLFLAHDEAYLSHATFTEIMDQIHLIASRLSALSKSLGRDPKH